MILVQCKRIFHSYQSRTNIIHYQSVLYFYHLL
nr:MAG TPA: hypothetical protein [Crassvirales sp.]